MNEPPLKILHACVLTTPRIVAFGCEQKNEGAQQYTLTDSADGRSVVLEVAVGRYLDTAQVKVDVQPLLVRCLVRGRLLQLHTPEVCGAQPLCTCTCTRLVDTTRLTWHSCVQEVCPDTSACQRSKTTGALVVTMPKLQAKPLAPSSVTLPKAAPSRAAARTGGSIASLRIADDAPAANAAGTARADIVPLAKMTVVYGDEDDDEAPPLLS